MFNFFNTDDDSEDSGDDLESALIAFLEGEGLEQFKQKMTEQFKTDAPSKSGKSRTKIMPTMEGIDLPEALWRVDEGHSVIDPSGVKLPSVSGGAGFIDEVLDNDLDIWTEIITEWGRTRSDITDITS